MTAINSFIRANMADQAVVALLARIDDLDQRVKVLEKISDKRSGSCRTTCKKCDYFAICPHSDQRRGDQ